MATLFLIPQDQFCEATSAQVSQVLKIGPYDFRAIILDTEGMAIALYAKENSL
ncbi:hypothetical protein [Legionella clemsonensis]|uniref:Uncharacterized protein n=1 Tax=Legionella clemsonensis TaxID=1867846 RepID=A0A222P159_9GAMM|nr:hypothetical protein [Legionella clemsonensis]ASQ45551.1 hypothetical protein clem_04970 [Legionella clemsonensis]